MIELLDDEGFQNIFSDPSITEHMFAVKTVFEVFSEFGTKSMP